MKGYRMEGSAVAGAVAVPADRADVSGLPPSPWVTRFAPGLPTGGCVLDLAAGGGRHTRLLLARGHRVVAVDRATGALADLAGEPRVTVLTADLEMAAWPLAGRRYAGIVVCNYLYRPHFDDLLAMLDTPGMLIYETFMLGNERYGKPSSPDFLLRSQELLERARAAGLRVLAYEEGYAATPRPAMVQRLCAVRGEYSPSF